MISAFFAAVSVAAVVIALAGLVTFGLGLRRIAAASATKRWPQVPGTILTSTVEEKLSTVQEDDGTTRPVHVFKASVTFRYKVGEAECEGRRLAPDELETSSRAPAEALAARYPVGAPVQVFHAPTDPSQAVLQPGVSGASAVLPSVGVALVFLGAAMFAIVWKVSGH